MSGPIPLCIGGQPEQHTCTAPLQRHMPWGSRGFSEMARFRQPSSWIFGLLPNVISDFLVHCLGHEHAYRIRSFCGHSNGYLLRVGTPSPFLHPPIRILLCSWLCLRLPARCVAVRTGRTGMVGHCRGKVVVRSEAQHSALGKTEHLGCRRVQDSPCDTLRN